MKVAIIPARGGSKRIPRKNIKSFNGKPMIAWTIEKIKKSNFFDEIIVSTDDLEIISVAKKLGVKVPFQRSKDLSDDFTITVPVIANAILECELQNWKIDYACCVYPCSPFIKIDDFEWSFNKMKEGNFEFIYPVTEYRHPVQRAMSFNDKCMMNLENPKSNKARTQDYKTLYHDTGQFYWGTRDAWVKQKSMHFDGTAFVTPSWRVVDIDTVDDWIRAEHLFRIIDEESK